MIQGVKNGRTVSSVVGGGKTITYIGNGSNRETNEFVFDIQVKNKLHVCFSTFWARGNFSVYGMKNGIYTSIQTNVGYGDKYEVLGLTVDKEGSYENIKIVVIRDEIYSSSCKYVMTVSAI